MKLALPLFVTILLSACSARYVGENSRKTLESEAHTDVHLTVALERLNTISADLEVALRHLEVLDARLQDLKVRVEELSNRQTRIEQALIKDKK